MEEVDFENFDVAFDESIEYIKTHFVDICSAVVTKLLYSYPDITPKNNTVVHCFWNA